jgi:hypothetical protein
VPQRWRTPWEPAAPSGTIALASWTPDGFIGDLERVEEPAAELSPTAALTDDELEVLTAIIAYERRFGPFGWNRADCKAMFYRGPVRGRWPTPEVLERIRAVYEELNRVPSVAEGVA